MDGEVILQDMPIALYIKLPGATWVVDDLEPGVYPLPPVSRTWELSKFTKISQLSWPIALARSKSVGRSLHCGEILRADGADGRSGVQRLHRRAAPGSDGGSDVQRLHRWAAPG